MGLDSSTQSLAFTVFDGNKPCRWGEIKYKGANTFDRIRYARRILSKLPELFDDIDVVGIEKTAQINSRQTALYMAMAAGVAISFFPKDVKVIEVPAMTWQSKTSKPILSKQEKEALKKIHPGKLTSWYKNEARLQSKQRTIEWVASKYGVVLGNDNVADSFCIAVYLAGQK